MTEEPELTAAERRLLDALATGETVDFRTDDTALDDPAGGAKWGAERTIRGEFLARFLTGEFPDHKPHRRGVVIVGARISGRLDLSNARLGRLLFLGCYVDKSIFLQDAKIDGLYLLGSRIASLNADRITVRGSVFLKDGFHATGEVRLLGADIGGDLDCTKGCFENPNGHALSADGITVKGDVFLNDGFHATSEVRLPGANIGGNLGCNKGKFKNPGGRALVADGITVRGSIFLNDGFRATGEVRLPGADIGGDLECANGQFSGDSETPTTISLQTARIKGSLLWTGVRLANGVVLDLHLAHVGTLIDDPQSWPGIGRLFLDGFTYDRFGGDAPTGWEARRDWLGRQPRDDSGQKIADAAAKEDPPQNKFRPQPHEQLVKVLRVMGHDHDARRIAIDKQHVLRARGDLNRREKAWNWLLDVTIRYGYASYRALWFILGFVLLGTVIFYCANEAGLMVPTKESVSVAGSDIAEVYPGFNPLIYSLDSFLPIVDLHQEAYWLPSADRGLYRIYLWLHIGLGWFLTTLAVVGFTGLVKKE